MTSLRAMKETMNNAWQQATADESRWASVGKRSPRLCPGPKRAEGVTRLTNLYKKLYASRQYIGLRSTTHDSFGKPLCWVLGGKLAPTVVSSHNAANALNTCLEAVFTLTELPR